MFLQNKYTTWYYNIITGAKSRDVSPDTYVERHHIIPRALGGLDSVENLVRLTAKEHFICHLLLTKMLDGQAKHKMIYAANRMLSGNNCQNRYRTTSNIYQYIKSQASKARSLEQRGVPQTEASNQKRAATLRGRTTYQRTAETIRRLKETKKAHPQVPWNKGKPSPNKGLTYEELYGTKKAKELKAHRSKVLKGRKIPEETRRYWSKIRKGKTALSKNPNARPVTINDTWYGCKKEACAALGISLFKLNKLLSSN